MKNDLEQVAGFALIPVASLKMTREALCAGQTYVNSHQSERIQAIIDQIDVHRPLGPDGKHGNLHTPTCGCEL